MPRIQEYHSLRARGLCTQCARPSSTTRCITCQAKEVARRKRYKTYSISSTPTPRRKAKDIMRKPEYKASENTLPKNFTPPPEDIEVTRRRKELKQIQRKHGHEPAPHREDTGRENTRAHASRTSHFMADRKLEAFDHAAAAERDMIEEQYTTRQAKKTEKIKYRGKNITVRVRRK